MDSRIAKKSEDPEFLRALSRRVRPSMIFDENGSVLADIGAMAHIADFEVVRDGEDAFDITVHPTEHIALQPILESLDTRFVISARRGHKYDWVFRLDHIDTLLAESSAEQTGPLRFRLEIVR